MCLLDAAHLPTSDGIPVLSLLRRVVVILYSSFAISIVADVDDGRDADVFAQSHDDA